MSPAVFEIWQFNEKLALVAIKTPCPTVRRDYFQKIFSYFKVSKTPTTFWKVQDFYLQKNFFTSHLAQSNIDTIERAVVFQDYTRIKLKSIIF